MPTTVLTFSHLQLPRSLSSLSHTFNAQRKDEYARSYPQVSSGKKRLGKFEHLQTEQLLLTSGLGTPLHGGTGAPPQGVDTLPAISTEKPSLQSVGNIPASSTEKPSPQGVGEISTSSTERPSPQGAGNISATGDATAICIFRFGNKAVDVSVPAVATGQELLSLGMRAVEISPERAQHLYLLAGHRYLELRNSYRFFDLPNILEIRERGCRGGSGKPKWDTNEQELLTSGLGTPLDGGTGAVGLRA